MFNQFKRFQTFAIAAAVGSVLTLNAFATTGDAGCGLGSLIFTKNTIISQILAATTNGTFSNQTFAITSGTSNCSRNGLVMNEKEQIYFAEANYRNLQVDMAKGSGESLSGFAQVLGCSEKSLGEFSQMTRSKYESIFPSEKTTPIEMLKSVKSEIQSSPTLSKECV